MSLQRTVSHVLESQSTVDGAGVKLKRVFGHMQIPALDPFLLLDSFGSNNPADYLAGFPWHPHRGMETVTYMLSGEVEHQDSLRNKGTIKSGDLQWMTAGSGIIHQEMPQKTAGMLRGMQLWVNLPHKAKMSEPKYRDVVHKDVPTLEISQGVSAKLISGTLLGSKGPVDDLTAKINYFHFTLQPGKEVSFDVDAAHNAFAFLLNGSAQFGETSVGEGRLALFGKGKELHVKAHEKPVDFIFASGEPIGEPIAWGGPIVMNTDEELDLAFRELQDGTFIKKKPEKEVL